MKLRYQCEICSRSYLDERFAKICEATVLPECPVKIGDNIKVYARYGEPQPDIVEAITVGKYDLCDNFEDIEGSDADNYLVFLEKEKFYFHRYNVEVNNMHQTRKDTYTRIVELSQIMNDKGEYYSHEY